MCFFRDWINIAPTLCHCSINELFVDNFPHVRKIAELVNDSDVGGYHKNQWLLPKFRYQKNSVDTGSSYRVTGQRSSARYEVGNDSRKSGTVLHRYTSIHFTLTVLVDLICAQSSSCLSRMLPTALWQ